jgi:hypothetical protein
MARKPKTADKPARPDVRVSLRLSHDDHKRLSALALATNRKINQVLIDALRPLLLTVRIPWVVGSAGESSGIPERNESAA